MIFRFTISVLAMLAFASTTFPARALAEEMVSGSIQIKGSDTMVNLGQGWAEAFGKKYPKTSCAVTGGGSGTGIAALINGTADIAMSSRKIKEKEIKLAQKNGIEPYEFEVGKDGLAVVVNPKNPVSRLTIDELAEIFTGKTTNWKALGGENIPIVILSREVNSGTHIYFKEHVLRKGDEKSDEEFAPSALLMPSSQAIADEVAQNPNAIGYYGMGYIELRHKVIAVALDTKSEYVAPVIENVRSGRYPVSRPLFLYTKNAPAGLVKAFVDFVLSDEGQEIVRKVDFVPLR